MKMKKVLAPIVAASIVFSFTSCKSSVQTSNEAASSEVVNQASTEVDINDEEAWKKEPMYGKTILIGYNGGLCTGAPGIAHAKGFFKEAGIDTEIVSIQTQVDALGTGKCHLATDHIATLLVPTVNGVDMVFKKGAHTGCKSLYTLKGGGFDSTEDLKGQTISISDGIGASDHNIGLRFLNHDNIEPEEVNFKVVESTATILAMQNGEIAGSVLSDQFAEKFVQDGTLQVVRSLTWDDDFKLEPCCVHAFNRTFVEENPITAAKITKVLDETKTWVENNTEEAAQVLFDNNWASGDFDQAVRMMESYDWEIDDEKSEKALINIIDDYKKFGLIKSDKSTEQILEMVWQPEEV